MPNTMTALDGRTYRSTGEQARGVPPADIGMTPQQRFLCVRAASHDESASVLTAAASGQHCRQHCQHCQHCQH